MGDAPVEATPAADPSPVIEAVVRRWEGLIQRAAGRFGLSGADLDELVQEVRLRVWRALAQRGGSAATLSPGYGHHAAVSAAIDVVRRRRSRGAVEVPIEGVAYSLVAPATTGAGEAEMVAALERALAGLDAPRRILSGRRATASLATPSSSEPRSGRSPIPALSR